MQRATGKGGFIKPPPFVGYAAPPGSEAQRPVMLREPGAHLLTAVPRPWLSLRRSFGGRKPAGHPICSKAALRRRAEDTFHVRCGVS